MIAKYISNKINSLILDKFEYVDLIKDNKNILGQYKHDINEFILIKKNENDVQHTILHEMFHSTGHKSRLNRFNDNTFGGFYKQLNINVYDIEYDKIEPLFTIIEELIVEIAIYNLNWSKYHKKCNQDSSFLCRFYWEVKLNNLLLDKELHKQIKETIEYQAKLINKVYTKYLFWKKIETFYKLVTYKTI